MAQVVLHEENALAYSLQGVNISNLYRRISLATSSGSSRLRRPTLGTSLRDLSTVAERVALYQLRLSALVAAFSLELRG